MQHTFQDENPFWRWMGFTIDAAAAQNHQAVVRVRVRDEFFQHQQLVHGGVLSALIDSAGAWAFALAYEEGVRTITLSVQYLNPVGRDCEELQAHARIVTAGHRIVHSEVEVYAAPAHCVARGQVIYTRARRR